MRLIAFVFNDYEAGGALHDAYKSKGKVVIFPTEQVAIVVLEQNDVHDDTVEIVDIDTLETIAVYQHIYDIATDTSTYIKQ